MTLNTMCSPQLQKFAYSVKNSSTILLPEWNKVLKQLAEGDKALSLCIMPRDVSTHWNSTYDMLKFAYAYRDAINQMTDQRALNLRHCVLPEVEWELVKQLWDVLKVCHTRTDKTCLLTNSLRSSRQLLCNSQVIPHALHLLFWPWIRCIMNSPRRLKTPNTHLCFKSL
jgi:hypothetical protein